MAATPSTKMVFNKIVLLPRSTRNPDPTNAIRRRRKMRRRRRKREEEEEESEGEGEEKRRGER